VSTSGKAMTKDEEKIMKALEEALVHNFLMGL